MARCECISPVIRGVKQSPINQTPTRSGLASYSPAYQYDAASSMASTYARASVAARPYDGALLPNNMPITRGSCTLLEGSATNTALWSNSFTAEHGHTLTNCTTSVSGSEYVLVDESGAPRYATILTATADQGRVSRENLSVTAGTPVNWSIHVKAISGKFRFAGYDGSALVSVFFDCATRTFSGLSDPSSISSQLQYEDIGNGWFRLSVTITPTVTASNAAASIGLELSGNSGYISGAQFVTAPVVTSYIYTEASAVTRASAGADTSGNGLSLPLSRAMVDSLTGEASDWTAAWSHVSGTVPAYSGGNKILTYSAQTSTDYHALLPAGVSVGDEIEVSYTIGSLTGGTFQLGFGSGATGESRSANGAYIERGTLTADTNLYAIATGLTGTVTINYCRRVLESGQTNPGEGTLLQAVDVPFSSTALPESTLISLLTTINGTPGLGAQFYIGFSSGTFKFPAMHTGYTLASYSPASFTAGPYVFVSQWSAALGKMRVGIYDPTTRTLTWSSPTLAGGTYYRGFFPIYGTGSQMRLRWGYGLSNFPIWIGPMEWADYPQSDPEIIATIEGMDA